MNSHINILQMLQDIRYYTLIQIADLLVETMQEVLDLWSEISDIFHSVTKAALTLHKTRV
jgi:hypothetical protein